jgi:hypothetical protein
MAYTVSIFVLAAANNTYFHKKFNSSDFYLAGELDNLESSSSSSSSFYSCCSHLEQSASVKRSFHFSFLILNSW